MKRRQYENARETHVCLAGVDVFQNLKQGELSFRERQACREHG